METRYVLSEYLGHALAQAEFDKLEDGTFSGRIPVCIGVIAFGGTLRVCEEELRSALEDWLLLGLKLGQSLPILDGISLNEESKHESLEPVCARSVHMPPPTGRL